MQRTTNCLLPSSGAACIPGLLDNFFTARPPVSYNNPSLHPRESRQSMHHQSVLANSLLIKENAQHLKHQGFPKHSDEKRDRRVGAAYQRVPPSTELDVTGLLIRGVGGSRIGLVNNIRVRGGRSVRVIGTKPHQFNTKHACNAAPDDVVQIHCLQTTSPPPVS